MCDAFVTSLSNFVPFTVGPASCAADVVIVLESSGQLTELGFYAMRQLAADIIKGLPEDVRVGLIVYATAVYRTVLLDGTRNYLLSRLLTAPYT